jgi:hypothetical protein
LAVSDEENGFYNVDVRDYFKVMNVISDSLYKPAKAESDGAGIDLIKRLFLGHFGSLVAPCLG